MFWPVACLTGCANRQIVADPGLSGVRIIILTTFDADEYVFEAIRAGAHGYLLKEIDGRGLIQAVFDVAEGKSILDPAVTARVIQLVKGGSSASRDALAVLSPQERKVLALIAEGQTNKEVASGLGLAEKTVKNYLSNIFEKLHVSRRSQGNRDRSHRPHAGFSVDRPSLRAKQPYPVRAYYPAKCL